METTRAEQVLHEECALYCRYLTGLTPSPYITGKYVEGHHVSDIERRLSEDRFDRLLARWSRLGTVPTRIADIYTRWFYRRSVLRHKLLLLLAILECAPETHMFFEAGESRSQARFWLWLISKTAGFLVYFAISAVLFSAARLVLHWWPESAVATGAERQWARS